MQFFYGSHAHTANSVGFRLYYRTIYDRFHRRMGEVQTWHVSGVVQAATQAALTTALGTLESAYSTDFQDITLKDNSAANTQHVTISANTFSGVQVAHFGYGKGSWDMQTEYGVGNANKRTFEAILTADTRTGGGSSLYAYREKVTRIGTGGPVLKYMGSLTGVPVLQTLRVYSPVRYIQEGYVIGRGQYLNPPAALTALGHEKYEQRILEDVTPEDIRKNGTTQKQELYRTNYRYVLENTIAGIPYPTTVTL